MATRTTSLGVGIALLAAVVGLGVYAGVRFLFFGLDEATPWDKPASLLVAESGSGAAAEVDAGTQVALTYEGRECRDRVDVEVDEDAATVVITITESVRAVVCGDGAERTSTDVSIDLATPLGDRRLVDGACRLGQFTDDPRCADDLVLITR